MPSSKLGKLDYPGYILFVPAGAVGANKVYFDLWNGLADGRLEISSLKAIKDGSVAVTGTLAVNLFATRTTAKGTGGTAATEDGTALTAATFCKLDPALPDIFDDGTGAYVSARLAPSGGAAGGAVLGFGGIFTEETSPVNYEGGLELLPAPVMVDESTGIRVVQDAVASVGNIAFLVLFRRLGDGRL